MEDFKKVDGEKTEHEIKLYAISTCPWCKRTKSLLDELEVEYEYVDIDKLEGENKENIREELKEHNSSGSVPTLIIDNGETIIQGHKEKEIRECLEEK